MKTAKTIEEIRKYINEWKLKGYSIGLVPTMGYLHEGHLSLINRASENDRVVVSIFVNPMQFGPQEDMAAYPRDWRRDNRLCEENGVDLIFHPDEKELYEADFCTYVNMSVLTEELCGLSRPFHFRGVCTVVAKLFNIVAPDRAYFGEKDAQQLAIIKQMVKDLNFNIKVIGSPIIREKDGLAKSSRNTYLNEVERKAAQVLSGSIRLGKKRLTDGEKDTTVLIRTMKDFIENEPLAKIDYLKVVDAASLRQVEKIERPVLVAMAVYIGKTRLIDNFTFDAQNTCADMR
jgi:pantoate--beta-alanine ligase